MQLTTLISDKCFCIADIYISCYNNWYIKGWTIESHARLKLYKNHAQIKSAWCSWEKMVYFWDAVRVFYIRVWLYLDYCEGVEFDFYSFYKIF